MNSSKRKCQPLRIPLCYIAGILLACLAPENFAATQADESELKAAFVYNFVLFTTWPQLPPKLNICVANGKDVFNQLSRYEGRKVQDTPIHVEQIRTNDSARKCHVIFVDTDRTARPEMLFSEIEGLPVLTITTGKSSEGIIQLIEFNERFTFEINQSEAERSGLTLSYKLLKLAKRVN